MNNYNAKNKNPAKKATQILAVFISSLLISTGSAFAENQSSQPANIHATENKKPSVAYEGNRIQQKTAPEAEAPGNTSLDFFLSESQKVLQDTDHQIQLANEVEPMEPAEAPKEIRPAKKITRHRRAAEKNPQTQVVIMTSEKCSRNGASGNENSECTRSYSDQSSQQVTIDQKTKGAEFRQMTTIADFDARHDLQNAKTIYQGTQRNASGTKKEFEFFEITVTPRQGNATKEILIYDFYPDSGQVKKMTWAKYEQSDDLKDAVLVSHTYLTYGLNGKPEKGVAESLENGAFTAEFLNWDDTDPVKIQINRDAWRVWENWIQSRQLSAYLS